MSRRSCTDEKGQALLELVLAAFMLLPVFLVLFQSMRYIYARLELVSLTRETAMFMIHENRSSLPDGLVKDLAKKSRLNPDDVSAKVESALLAGQFADIPALGSMGALATQFLAGSNLKVSYRLHFGGALGRAVPDGVLLTESVTFQAGCWKNLGTTELLKILFNLG